MLLRCALVVSVWCAFLPAQADPGARPGYRYRDEGFAGEFADSLNRLVLEVDGDRVVGRCDRGADWELTGTVHDGVLDGTARCLIAEKPMSARFVGDQLLLRIDDIETPFLRVVPVDAALADLGPPVLDEARRWTLAVYLGGDNDLENAAIDDLNEMLAAMPQQGVEVVVLLDRLEHQQKGDGIWSDTRVFRLDPAGGGAMEVLALPGERDTGDARTLASFLCGAFAKYPAPHRAVVIWDHGGGWTGVVSDHDAPGTPNGRDMLNLMDVRLALRTARLRVQQKARVDLLVFDACLMAHLENAVELMESADWLVASQAIVPGSGMPYDRVLPLFAATDAAVIARGMVEAFGGSYAEVHDSTVTFSAVDLARVPRIAEQLDRFAEALLPGIDDNWPQVGRAMFYGESYQPRTKRRTDKWGASLDLVDVVRRLCAGVTPLPDAAKQAADELERAVAAAVVARTAGEQRVLSHGLSVFAPYRYMERLGRYGSLALAAGNRWTALLTKLHILALGEASTIAVDDVQLHCEEKDGRRVVRPWNGNVVTFAVTGRGIVEVEQWDSVRDGDGWVVLRKNLVRDPGWLRRLDQAVADEADRVMPQFAEGRNELGSELVGMQFLIDNRGDTLRRATLDLLAPSTQSALVAQARMTMPDQPPQDVEVHFDRAWWRVNGVYPLHCDEEDFEQRRIAPEAATEFRFVLQTIADDGTQDQVLGEPIAWREGLWLVLDQDQPGRYRATLRARTLDGREQDASIDYDLEANPDLDRWTASWQTFDPARLVGRWPQSLAVGPDQWQESEVQARFVGSNPMGPGVFDVECEIGPAGKDGVSHQTWVFEQRGVPNLRVVTEIADGRTFCWYGPAAWGITDERPFVVMKAINVPGVIWRWQQSIWDSMAPERDKDK
ncbi:MAG: hypothetical protein JNL08_12885 [Planctomycetes bacterium]|nr:hypothetical protein [Planctomycetota bacterium]